MVDDSVYLKVGKNFYKHYLRSLCHHVHRKQKYGENAKTSIEFVYYMLIKSS